VEAIAPIRAACATDAELTELYVHAVCKAGLTATLDAFYKQVTAGPRPALPLAAGAEALRTCGHPFLAVRWAGEATRLAPTDRIVRKLNADSLRDRALCEGAPAWNTDYVRAAIAEY